MKKTIIIFFGASIFFCGICIGIIGENIRQTQHKNSIFTPVEIDTPKIPVLTLKKIENGNISGNITHSNIHIVLQENKTKVSPVHVFQAGDFQLDIRTLLPMLREIPHPKGTQFVASKRGKKYYPIDSPNAFLVSVKNRIFFKNQEEAEGAGFKR